MNTPVFLLIHSILFYALLLYSILCTSIIFYSILFYALLLNFVLLCPIHSFSMNEIIKINIIIDKINIVKYVHTYH